MKRLVINGGKPLHGEVYISGSKNAAVGIVAATILANDICVLENVPDVSDIKIMLDVLTSLGANCKREGEIVEIDTRGINTWVADQDSISKMRGSSYLMGALLGRFHKAQVYLPGGCSIGPRPIDQHLKGFSCLGSDNKTEFGRVTCDASNGLFGNNVYLDLMSVGATINIMLAACTAVGNTVIENCAMEPHVVDVANFLNAMGASIRGAGTDVIRITGRRDLHGCTYAIIPDQIEAGTYMVAAAATKGDVIIKNIIPAHLEAISAKLMECGVEVIEGDSGTEFFMHVRAKERPRAVNIRTLPYPGFPTDLQQPMTSLLAVAYGNSFVTENLFEDRFNHVRELNRMGARITLNGRTALVAGVEKLYGAEITATDLRAGAAMIVAALMAEGTSIVRNIHYIDRGYEKLTEKLRGLGANITRVEE